jgi:hypothetical protein
LRPTPDVTLQTVSNSRFFPGTVALLNSMALTGNRHPVTVLDVGLAAGQRRLLDRHCCVVDGERHAQAPLLFKPFGHGVQSGVVVVADSDMIFTGSLERILAEAREGGICAFADPDSGRWFAEWEQIFDLSGPLRRETYVNTGLIAFSATRWGWLLSRWLEACTRIPEGSLIAGTAQDRSVRANGASHPVAKGDQDALNALLMSEVPAGAVVIQPAGGQAFFWNLRATRVVDRSTLACESGGRRVTVLHFNGVPKPWEPASWRRVRRDAYSRLLPRVLFADDVPIRLEPASFPIWMRADPSSAVSLTALEIVHRIGHGLRGVGRRLARLAALACF